MKKLLLILLCLPMIGFGQGWIKTYGDNYEQEGHTVQETTDGGYIVTGFDDVFGNEYVNALLIKYDTQGNILWNKNYGTNNWAERALCGQQTSDGGYVMCGNSTTVGTISKGIIIKTDTQGDTLWIRNFPNYFFRIIRQTNDGGYILCGSYIDSPTYSGFIKKVDNSGYEQWTKMFSNFVKCVEQTNDGGYIIGLDSSYVSSQNLNQNSPFIIKTDVNGIPVWNKLYNFISGEKSVYIKNIKPTINGYIIGLDVGLINIDNIGDTIWSKKYFQNDINVVCRFGGFQISNNGGYVLVGGIADTSNNMNAIILKVDDYGNIEWNKIYDVNLEDILGSVDQTSDGGYIMTGYTTSAQNYIDILTIKTDGNGNITSTFNIPINPNRKLDKTVDILGKETKPKKNIPFIEIYDDGTVEKKIIIE